MSVTPLSPLSSFKGRPGPLLLIILDGVGISPVQAGNAVAAAKTPVLDALMKLPLYRTLKAHGRAVGMPTDEDMGNSEVGHNALGAGRVFDQGAALVDRAVRTGDLFKGRTWNDVLTDVKAHQSTLHFIGLLSDGNVHAHIDHLLAMLREADKQGMSRVRVHVLLDGRDVDQKSALRYLDRLEAVLSTINGGAGRDYRIASGGGRMITTMDRYNADWSIVERGWKAHVLGDARPFVSARQAVETFYTEDPKITDQYLPSFVVAENGEPVGRIQDGDGVIMTHFRGDRAIELSVAFESDELAYFDRVRRPKVYYAAMMEYDGDLHIPTHFLVDPPAIAHPVSEYLCASGVSAFAISETQKFGHVTYFWNGNRSGYFNPALETYVEIPSDRVPFDQKPDMKAPEITEKTLELLASGQYKFGRLNFPNGDMVGHTGNFDAAVRSIETTDRCTGQLIEAVNRLNGITVVLADHGNADEMFIEKNGIRSTKTAHTLNPVPFAIVDSGYHGEYRLAELPQAGLANVAATVCELLGYQSPPGYEPSLITFQSKEF